jgi:hypothetical protein
VLRREIRPAEAPALLLVQHAVPGFAFSSPCPLHPPTGPLPGLGQRRPRDLKEADDHVEPRRVGWERRRRVGHVFEYEICAWSALPGRFGRTVVGPHRPPSALPPSAAAGAVASAQCGHSSPPGVGAWVALLRRVRLVSVLPEQHAHPLLAQGRHGARHGGLRT